MINKNKYHADEEPAVGIIKERFKEKKRESTLSIKKKVRFKKTRSRPLYRPNFKIKLFSFFKFPPQLRLDGRIMLGNILG